MPKITTTTIISINENPRDLLLITIIKVFSILNLELVYPNEKLNTWVIQMKKFSIVLLLTLLCSKFGFASAQKIYIKHEQKQFVIQVKAIPTTGFVWSVKSYNKKLFKFEGSEYLKPKNPKLIGAPLQQLFKFKILKSIVANNKITLSLARSWESKEAKQVKYSIILLKKSGKK